MLLRQSNDSLIEHHGDLIQGTEQFNVWLLQILDERRAAAVLKWRLWAKRRVWNSHETIAVILGALAFGAIYTYPLLWNLTVPSIQNDWDFNAELNWVAYITLTQFHQFPLWNPYKCGGMGMLANPQSRFLSPFFLLHLLFKPTIGLHLEVTLHLAVMWAGCYVMARALRLPPLAAVVTAVTFCSSSWFSMHLGEGQIVMLPFAYLPWLIAIMLFGLETPSRIPAVIAGALLALIVFEGGVLIILYGGPLLLMVAIVEAVRRRSLRPFEFLAIAGVLGVGLAAFKLIPSYQLTNAHPRAPWGAMAIHWDEFPRIFWWREQQQLASDDRFFIEFSNYISPAFLLLGLIAVVTGRWRALPWLAMAGIFLLAARGDDGEIPFWRWLKHLPMYSEMRLSSRFDITLTLCVGIVAAYGVDALARFGKVGVAIAATLIALGAIDSLVIGPPFLWHAFDREEQPMETPPSFHQFYDIILFDQTLLAKHNTGMPFCYEYTPWPTSVLGFNQSGYRGEQYMVGQGQVELLRWSPNRLQYEIEAPTPATLVVNQNYDRNWELRQGAGQIVDEGGLLAVQVPAATQQIDLVYSGWAWKVGSVVSLVSLVAAVLLVVDDRRRRGRFVASSAQP